MIHCLKLQNVKYVIIAVIMTFNQLVLIIDDICVLVILTELAIVKMSSYEHVERFLCCSHVK